MFVAGIFSFAGVGICEPIVLDVALFVGLTAAAGVYRGARLMRGARPIGADP